MATSFTDIKWYIKSYIKQHFEQNSSILDIGAGCGTYYELLKEFSSNIDAIEAFQTNIDKFNLKNKYREVICADIVQCQIPDDKYDIIIMGDVLEHINVLPAKTLIRNLSKKCKLLLVAVPYLMEQDAIEDNDFEEHKQPDLTVDIMKERYPQLKLLIGDDRYGYYVNKEAPDVEETMLSLIIPCHNLEKYIERCVESIVMQNNICGVKREAIFICDNCTDHTADIIEDVMRKSSWKYQIIPASKGSPGGARNVGLDAAKGKYIWFIDGDDWLVGENAIDVVLGCILAEDKDIIQFKIRSNANPLGIFGTGTVWQAMFSARLIGDYRFNDRQNGEDNDFCAEMWDRRHPNIGKIDFAPYFYNYPREGSQSDKAYSVYKNKKSVIAMACTRNYYQYLYTWVYALTRENYYRKLYLIIEDDKLNLPFINIEYININKIPLNPEGANYNTGYSKASMARLYLANLIPEDKVLYLDTDLIVRKNLDELWSISMDDHYVAGVIDQGAKKFLTPNLPVDADTYINSGVTLFNLKKIREDNMVEKLDKFINENKLYCPDQDTINVVFKDKILFLPNKYNSSIFTGEAPNCLIYHWAGGKENWVYNREHADWWKEMEKHQDPDFKLKIN